MNSYARLQTRIESICRRIDETRTLTWKQRFKVPPTGRGETRSRAPVHSSPAKRPDAPGREFPPPPAPGVQLSSNVVLLRRPVAATKDPRVLAQLVASNQGLIYTVAKRYRHLGHPLEDMMQEGNIGLLRAAEMFDPARAKWSTYAVWWIRAFIKRYVEKASTVYTSNPGRTVGQFGSEHRFRVSTSSLDAPAYHDSETTLLDGLAANDLPADQQLEQHQLRQKVRDAVDRSGWPAGSMARTIVEQRLLRSPPATLDDIGRQFGRSRERVRQVEMKVRARLARLLEPLRAEVANG